MLEQEDRSQSQQPRPDASCSGAPLVLIAALSGRALAVAARRAGYAPLVADLFGDTDMRAAAARSAKVPGDLEAGLDEDGLVDCLTRLAAGRDCAGLVC